MGSIYMTWLLDSLFNDMCVLFVGFSPIEDSLDTVAAARELGTASAVGIFRETDLGETDQNVGSGEDGTPADAVVGALTPRQWALTLELDDVELEQVPTRVHL